jgi:hypothetical protein
VARAGSIDIRHILFNERDCKIDDFGAFNLQDFLLTKILPKGHSFDSDYVVLDKLRDIEARVQEDHSMSKPKGGSFISAHHSKRSVSEVERIDIRPMPHPPYRPDISPCDFWLFGLVKRILKWRKLMSGDDLLNSLLEIGTGPIKAQISNVYHQWIKRGHEVI